MRYRIRLFLYLTLIVEFCGAAAAETFRFWPGDGATAAPGFKRMSEHPCGEVAEAEVAKLPPPEHTALRPDLVVELDRRDKVIRRWPTPVDFTPWALSGDELLVVLRAEGYWVRPDGSFRTASTIPPPNDTQADCDLQHVFGKSAYNGCGVFTDLANGRKRKLGYQGVCS